MTATRHNRQSRSGTRRPNFTTLMFAKPRGGHPPSGSKRSLQQVHKTGTQVSIVCGCKVLCFWAFLAIWQESHPLRQFSSAFRLPLRPPGLSGPAASMTPTKRVSRCLFCKSARSPDADTHDKPLKFLGRAGSIDGAVLQSRWPERVSVLWFERSSGLTLPHETGQVRAQGSRQSCRRLRTTMSCPTPPRAPL